MHLNIYKRSRIIFLYCFGLRFVKKRFEILRRLALREDIVISTRCIRNLIRKWIVYKKVADLQSVERGFKNVKVTPLQLRRIERLVLKNTSLTAPLIKAKLNLSMSVRTIQRYINLLGWRKIRAKYCQFVSDKNRIERACFVNVYLRQPHNFCYNIFIDECIIKANRNANRVWYKPRPGQIRIGLIGRYSHPVQINVIGGISRRGPTHLVVFEGAVNTNSFQELLDDFLIPFIQNIYPDYHALNMDNARYHTADLTRQYLLNHNINHFKTPAQSPDLNPIEMVWKDMKDYLATVIRPRDKNTLINGVLQFWNTVVTVPYCNAKIDHLYRVIKEIVRLDGKATGL